jgi:hypothetical protein
MAEFVVATLDAARAAVPDAEGLRKALVGILGEAEEYTMYQHGNPVTVLDAVVRRARAALADEPRP